MRRKAVDAGPRRSLSEAIWSAPAERSDDGALDENVGRRDADESKAVSRCARRRTPNLSNARSAPASAVSVLMS